MSAKLTEELKRSRKFSCSPRQTFLLIDWPGMGGCSFFSVSFVSKDLVAALWPTKAVSHMAVPDSQRSYLLSVTQA